MKRLLTIIFILVFNFSFLNAEVIKDTIIKNELIKDLSEKLFNWTNRRWIISFSKKKGEVTRKISKEQIKQDKIKEFKKTECLQNRSIPNNRRIFRYPKNLKKSF